MGFKAILCEQKDGKHSAALTELDQSQLMEGDALIDVDYSTINYKDGLAITGAAPIIRTYPMVAGIDLAGKVASSSNSDFPEGTRVVLNGYGLSETHSGGLAQKAQVKSKWLIKLPDNISTEAAMAIGTAGYTAALCVLALEDHHITPERGKVIVSGAAGGVGSVAIILLSALGYDIIASTGRSEESDYLKKLGAKEIISRDELSAQSAPIGKPRWVGGVDSVGSHTLANILAATDYRGCVACCGLAQGMDLPASVAPFILRNITLAGIDSVQAPLSVRQKAWQKLSDVLDRDKLALSTTKVKLSDVPQLAGDILAGKVRGRVVVDVNA
jgi:acrylyl-CoA reductase (NADPH)